MSQSFQLSENIQGPGGTRRGIPKGGNPSRESAALKLTYNSSVMLKNKLGYNGSVFTCAQTEE